jgi:tricarballylate dehydrogenase
MNWRSRRAGSREAAPTNGRQIVVIGGGNAALCAALAAADGGASVTMLEAAPRLLRGGNTRHTRNLRALHDEGDGFVTGSYKEDEFFGDLVEVTGTDLDENLARFTIRDSGSLPAWMQSHGAKWQAPLKGTLGLARTNRFFLGGGKALVNAYYAEAARLGVDIRYDTRVTELLMDGRRCTGVVTSDGARQTLIKGDAFVVASGGFEASREWLREYWGDRADNFVIRGTPYNDGLVLRRLLDLGATRVADPKGLHAIAVDARAPRQDGGIVTRLDSIPLGIALNRDAERFGDEGANIWPKRYASWGRLIADQPDQIASSIFDSQMLSDFIPGVFPPLQANSIAELAALLNLNPVRLEETIRTFNAHVRPGGTFDLRHLDDCSTVDLDPPKSHWARPIEMPPFFAYPLRTGVTFTYMGVAVDDRSRIRVDDGGVFDNLYAAGEIMAGNILKQGYLAGFGLTIGSVFGRLAGTQAAMQAGGSNA